MIAPRGRAELHALLDAAEVSELLHGAPFAVVDETTWRTGIAGDDQPGWQAAAHATGSVTAWRRVADGSGRAVELQVVPLADPAGAAAALAAATAHGLRRAPVDDVPTRRATTDRFLVIARGEGVDGAGLDAVVAAQLARL